MGRSVLNIITLNVRGLGSVAKRRKLFLWIKKQQPDIIFMQETHCTKSNVNNIDSHWLGPTFHSLSNSSRSRGVSILFNPKMNIKVIDEFYDNDGRKVLLNLEYENRIITLVNVYAPNHENERNSFFCNTTNWVIDNMIPESELIVGGDFNCCLRESDRSTKTHLNDKSRGSFKNLIAKLNLSDIWCKMNTNDTCHYTWNDNVTYSRLDYIFTTQNSSLNLISMDNITVIKHRAITDHKAVVLKCEINRQCRGPGYWKLNVGLLSDDRYCDEIEYLIAHLNDDINVKNLKPCCKWEILKLKIRECSIKYSVAKAKARFNEINSLETEANIINKKTKSDDDIMRLSAIENRLETLYAEELTGALIRAKIDEVKNGDCNIKYVKSVEKSRQSNNTIDCLVDNKGNHVTKNSEILENIGYYYEKLYSSNNHSLESIDNYLDTIHFDKILTEKQKESLEGPISEREFIHALNSLKERKTPGVDGIPIEFYKQFWSIIYPFYHNMIVEAKERGVLPNSTKTSLLNLIHKGESRIFLSNFRPLSITNYDYKILAFALAGRFQKVVNEIINFDQSASIRPRFIGTSVRNIIDIFEYCEANNKTGALLCTDFEKAYDTVEHSFLFSVLKRFNFGDNLISWIKLLYADPVFKVKNNGWISKSYRMERGIRQGCPISSILFIIVIEILAIAIRQSKAIHGIDINNNEHKIILYADDTTICVNDKESIPEVVKVITAFSHLAGPRLNMRKTRGIWLGPLKDHGIRIMAGITFTGKPVKCLGIYLGHDNKRCIDMNWNYRLEKLTKYIHHLDKLNLSFFVKVSVIKCHIVSKFVYPASVLSVPEEIIKSLQSKIYKFLWNGKTEKVKRALLCNTILNGGINMVNIHAFMEAIKASWITKIITIPGKWSDIFHMNAKYIGLPLEYIIKLSVSKIENFPILKAFPMFYQEILMSYFKSKSVKPFNKLTPHEIFLQPLWGNEHFKIKESNLYLKNWVKENIMYVKDLVTLDGSFFDENEIYKTIENKSNIIQEMYIIKRYVLKRFKHIDSKIGNHVNIKESYVILSGNTLFDLRDKKSKFFYKMLVKKNTVRANMESIYAREFHFQNSMQNWQSIYQQKLCFKGFNEVKYFNFKLIHNFLPCGNVLNKWQKSISKYCDLCNEIESLRHMLYDCPHIKQIWLNISNIIDCNINWKLIVCGFINYELTDKIIAYNFIFSVIAYSIFKENSKCKFNGKRLEIENIMFSIKRMIYTYYITLEMLNTNLLFNYLKKILCNFDEV